MKKLTILHSNDMHGHFLPEEHDGVMTGGLPLLAGYVNHARRKEKNVLYLNAGDMFQGSVIDSEYRGVSTIELMNILKPDAMTVGNHEVDYGVAHLLFLEKCARFPILNANMYVVLNHAHLFQPYINLRVNDMKILVIGLLTEEVLSSAKQEGMIGTLIDVEEAAKCVGIICDNYRTMATDMVILLTHIGIDQDKKLAALLKPEWGVDLIIGGHTHTFMDEPEYVNHIPIVQAGTGTGIIGRFDILYDDEEHEVSEINWQCVPINENTCSPDPVMTRMVESYKQVTDAKYKKIVTTFARPLTHPERKRETEMGNLYADIMQKDSSFDLMLFGSGSIRKQILGPIIEYQDMIMNTPFDDCIWMLSVTGKQLKQMVRYVFRDEAWEGDSEFYQFSQGIRIVYNRTTRQFEEFAFHSRNVEDDDLIKIGLQNFHYLNFTRFFSVPLDDVKKNAAPKIVATSLQNIVEEYLSVNQGLDAHVEGRWIVHD